MEISEPCVEDAAVSQGQTNLKLTDAVAFYVENKICKLTQNATGI